MRKPLPLRRGDLVSIVAPGAAVDTDTLQAGVRLLERHGFRVQIGAAVLKQRGYLAGGDDERFADLLAAFTNPEVRAIIAARGGYGSGRLLPRLARDLASCPAKIVVGYSDLTFLLNYLVHRCHLVTFHGPMVGDFDGDPAAAESLLRLLGGERTSWNASARQIVQPGTGEGIIVGGCLSILVAGLGTPYAVQTDGRLLFIEDVNERPFRIDRMLTQLRQAGKLERVSGVLFGEMTGCDTSADRVTVGDVIRDAFMSAGYPVVIGLPAGHHGVLTVPLGVMARLAGERLSLLESPLEDGRR